MIVMVNLAHVAHSSQCACYIYVTLGEALLA